MQRLLYISESTIEPAAADNVIAQIVADAQVRNTQLGLTGALLYTGKHFAQVLEGTSVAIDELMISLNRDLRHEKLIVVDATTITKRKFANWRMAYHGPSEFVSRQVTRLLHPTTQSEQQRAAEWLTELVQEFSALGSK